MYHEEKISIRFFRDAIGDGFKLFFFLKKKLLFLILFGFEKKSI